MKVFGVLMTLLLVFSFAATFSVSSTVSAGTQKWSKISIPDTADMQLAPGSDIGVIAVSPDGATLFAAVYNSPEYPATQWRVYKSTDGGFTWDATGYAGDGTPLERIVAIDVSPAWTDDDIVVVATTADVYISEKAGVDFQSMGATGLGTITSMDVALDENGDATYVIGTGGAAGDVYILRGFSGWEPQYIEDPDSNPMSAYTFSAVIPSGVFAVAFSPNYAEDGVVFAVIGGAPFMESDGTHLRAESDITVNNWGSYIDDAHFIDGPTGDNIVAVSGCIAFPDDYSSAPSVFVGLTAYADADGTIDFPDAAPATPMMPRGDAFRVDLIMGTLGTSAVTDLEIRGVDSRTNVYSLAVSGHASSAFILAGLRELSNTGAMTSWQGTVHYSSNGGETWLQSYKPPSGLLADLVPPYYMGHGSPTVIMDPLFAENHIAYCATGFDPIFTPALAMDTLFSGVYVTTTQGEGTTWNGRGLLDMTINKITDTVPSPQYDTDATLFMVTDSTLGSSNLGLLWETKDGGKTWELILSMTLMIPLPGIDIDKVEIPATYPDQPSIFVTGVDPAVGAPGTNALVSRSTDEGNLWATALKAPFDGAVPQVIQTWVVIDDKTLIVSSGNRIWKTTDMAAHWTVMDPTSEIGLSETVIDMKIFNDTTIIASTDQGNVYMCDDWATDFNFVQVSEGPGDNAAGDWAYVAFDTNFDENGIIYAGVWGNNQGIWRIDANSGDEWEQIYDGGEDIYSITCDGNGILWAIADRGVNWWPTSAPVLQSIPIREVNPTAPIDDIAFEYVPYGLTGPGTPDLWYDLESAPTETYVFAIGGAANDQLWTYIDTLIKTTLISPADGTTAAGTILQGTSNALVSLRWEDLAKAKQYQYQVAYDSGFGSIATDGITGASANGTLPGTQVTVSLFLGEKYYWRVRVYNDSPVYSQWSDTWSFTTPLGPASAKPVCMSPTEGLTGVSLTTLLQWSSAVEATGFELMLAANCDWSNARISLTGTSALPAGYTAYQVTAADGLQEDTNYCWKVRAINADTATNSPWSDTGTFTTLKTPVAEETGTPVWVWVVIALSAVLLVGVVVLIVRTRRPV